MSRAEKDAFGGKITELDRMTVKAPTARPGRWYFLMPKSCTTRAFSCGEIRLSLATACRASSSESWPDPTVARSHTAAAGSTWPRAITAAGNPLTARVIVNRVWMHHFGEPMVSTPSDFGTRSTPPTHPELLDYLASRLEQEGWSLKSLHRLIMLSATYQQASLDRPACRRADPENRLLWRFPRRRLDLEAMRDTLLFVSGRLDHDDGGTPCGCCRRSQERAKDDLWPGRSPEPARGFSRLRLRQPRPVGRAPAHERPCLSRPSSA